MAKSDDGPGFVGCLAAGCALLVVAAFNLLLLAAAVWVVKAVWNN